MTRGMIYKLALIFAIILFSVILILPTVDKKEMRIAFFTDAAPE